ncbi:MAG TPA: 2-phosphosulfolactate phosphatase [Marmoricola sp.]|nr:2-phosphosulfolactate phosphatase [Marmoricola sp.]HEU5045133.1 2-phosphosulfolactate phosphatase [Nocardioidaceae bacterium]
MNEVFGQHRFRVRMVWASAGAAVAVRRGDLAVVVDVLSFTTSLNVATDRGTEVYPFVFGSDAASQHARRLDANLAVGRRQVGSADQVSLSPASILAAPPMQRLVLPSPNGSAISLRLTDAGVTVVGVCLRNRLAVAAWLRAALADDPDRAVTVVAAGERWGDGSLRPAVEDLWGAGAVLAALDKAGTGFSPEALTAAAAFDAVRSSLGSALLDCASGQELATTGFADDVRIAAQLDVSDGVPVLEQGRFVAHRR